jgi:hypothetical protein
MQIARLSLENEDPDSAVNRAYYAMFNISRAALLKAESPRASSRERTVESARHLGSTPFLTERLMRSWRAL